MNERLNPDDYTDFEIDDEIDPTIPTSGPLYELFTEMLKIAQSYALTGEELREMSFELYNLFEARAFSVADENQHTIEEGGIMLDPLDQVCADTARRSEFYEYLDHFIPLVDGFSILVTRESEVGGRYGPEFVPDKCMPLDLIGNDE